MLAGEPGVWPVDRMTDADQRMLWPDEIWPQEIGALAVLDGGWPAGLPERPRSGAALFPGARRLKESHACHRHRIRARRIDRRGHHLHRRTFSYCAGTAAAGFGIAAWHDGGKADPYAIIVLRSNGPKATVALLFT